MMQSATVRSLVTMLGVMILSGSSLAAGSVSPFGKEKTVELADFGPHLCGDEWYKEEWNYNAWTAKGHFIAVDFLISNIGVGDHKGVFEAKFVESNGQRTDCKAELDSDEWSWSRTGFSLKFGKGRVRGDLKGFDIEVRCKNLKMDLRFENLAPPYKPGGGRLGFGKAGYYSKVFPSTRARVTGTIRRRGRDVAIDTPGIVEHSVVTVAPHKYARRWFRFRKVDQEASIVLAEVETPSAFGNTRHGWVMIYGPKGRLAASARVSFEFDGFIRDKNSEQGYSIPRRVRLAAVDGATHLTGQLVMTKLIGARDPTEKLPYLTKMFVHRFSKPMDYKIACTYSLRIKNGSRDRTLTGKGVYRFIYVNP